MLRILTNQIQSSNTELSSQMPFYSEWGFWGVLVPIVGLGIETFRRKQTRIIREPLETFIDDVSSARITIIRITISNLNNPFYKRIKLFEFEGQAEYRISGFEFNTHHTVIDSSFFQNMDEENRTKVMLFDKTRFRARSISSLLVELEEQDATYRQNIRENTTPERIIISNENDVPVRNYVFSLPQQTDVSRLRGDPRINDLHLDGHLWIARIAVLPPSVVGRPGEVVITF